MFSTAYPPSIGLNSLAVVNFSGKSVSAIGSFLNILLRRLMYCSLTCLGIYWYETGRSP